MPLVELVMPKMGESIMEATILHWLKKPGDSIEQDESVLEVATDKVDTEVPSTHAGILKEILAKEGEVVKIGKPIAIITVETEVETVPVIPAEPAKPDTEPAAKPATQISVAAKTNGTNGTKIAETAEGKTTRFYSPLVKNIAKQENIPVAELETISGSG